MNWAIQINILDLQRRKLCGELNILLKSIYFHLLILFTRLITGPHKTPWTLFALLNKFLGDLLYCLTLFFPKLKIATCGGVSFHSVAGSCRSFSWSAEWKSILSSFIDFSMIKGIPALRCYLSHVLLIFVTFLVYLLIIYYDQTARFTP